MRVSLADSVGPALFVSYSRKQEWIAREMRAFLSPRVRAVWLDVEQISAGDDWRREAHAAVAGCDELVLLVSDESLASRVVREEVELARELSKEILPIIVTPLSKPRPDWLMAIHYEELFALSVDERAAAVRRLLEPAPVARMLSGAELKRIASRRVYPEFRDTYVLPDGDQAKVRSIATTLSKIKQCRPASSAVWLNAGMASCLASDWDDGLEGLRAHARAAGTFAGWYFLSLHVFQAKSLLRVPAQLVREATGALRNAESFGDNPLSHLLGAALETAGENRGERNLAYRLNQFEAAHAARQETPSEYVRLYFCLRASLDAMGAAYKSRIHHLARRMSQ